MKPDAMSSWRIDFARSAAFRREQMQFSKEIERRQKVTDQSAKIDDDISEFAAAAMLASEAEIVEFRTELDTYRTATTEALMENERRLGEVQAEIDDMLAKAYVLPDGRRVFKTKDGLRVFDEHGIELSSREIDPDLIENWRPHADGYLDRRDTKIDLLTERDELLTFEERVELADERAKSGVMTKGEIEKLRGELEASAPLAARRNLPGYEERPIPNAVRDFGVAAMAKPVIGDLKLDMPELGR